jgi:hypothetical protein
MRKLSRKIDQRKTVQLSPDELDLLVDCGAWEAICKAALEFQRNQCRERNARSRSISAATSPSTEGPTGPTLKLSGTTPNANASEALAQAQAMLGAASRP